MKKIFIVMILIAGFAIAKAQVGSGWSSWSPSYSEQEKGTGNCNGSTFTITSTSTSTEQRAERRYSSFSSGVKQFQGTFKVNSLGGDGICVQQTFRDGVGAYSMIVVRKGGVIKEHGSGQTLGSYTIGSGIRFNAVAYASTGKVENYINGSLKNTKTGGSAPFYFKCGAYRTASGYGPVSITWSSLSFYQKSKSAELGQPENEEFTLTCVPTVVKESALIKYSVTNDALTSIVVYNLNAQKVKTFVNAKLVMGNYEAILEASDLSNGTYIVVLTNGGNVKTTKVVVSK